VRQSPSTAREIVPVGGEVASVRGAEKMSADFPVQARERDKLSIFAVDLLKIASPPKILDRGRLLAKRILLDINKNSLEGLSSRVHPNN
jgi:hypothetical protein